MSMGGQIPNNLACLHRAGVKFLGRAPRTSIVLRTGVVRCPARQLSIDQPRWFHVTDLQMSYCRSEIRWVSRARPTSYVLSGAA